MSFVSRRHSLNMLISLWQPLLPRQGEVFSLCINNHRCSVRLPCAGGGEFEWHFAEPSLLVASVVRAVPAVSEQFAAALGRRAPTAEVPWRLVVGYDEFVAGNKLRVDPTRKVMVISFSFLELGQVAVGRSLTWFTAGVLRSNQIARIRGGFSAVMRAFLERLLRSALGFSTP